MPINVRNKGQTGERELASRFNKLVDDVFDTLPSTSPYKAGKMPYPFQRNQNQSAVGGSDLSNPFGLSIEVKRQESLSLNTWWKQCVKAASEEGSIPILIYRQNRKPWRVVMNGTIDLAETQEIICRVEVSIDDFEVILKEKIFSYMICNF